MSRTIRIAGTVNDSIVDGPGMRYAIFTQGCHHNCPGCHNPHTHDPNGGQDTTVETLTKAIMRNPLLSGITLTGGEPFEQPEALIELVEEIKKSGNLEIAVYSGYTFEELTKDKESPKYKLLSLCDVLIDGPFILDQRSLELRYKGSRNQRTIDIQKSLKSGEVVLMNDGRWN